MFSQLARRQQWTLHVEHVEFYLERNLCPVDVSRPTFDNSGAVLLELDRVCSCRVEESSLFHLKLCCELERTTVIETSTSFAVLEKMTGFIGFADSGLMST